MFQFELHPHIDEICMNIMLYEKSWVIKHLKEPPRVKVELPDLWQNKIRENMEKGQTFFWKTWGRFVFVRPWDMVWNITIKEGKNYFTKKGSLTLLHTFLITRESEDEQKPVLVSGYPMPKIHWKSASNLLRITLHRDLNTLAKNHAT